ncbi:PRC-barrel domain-containing protein [Chryseomicrobium sp. FSL W7-1435]|uniref:PRC-barrel domain-containing protein n=1 Tax=Chryseomicrobium sp. FSL W7-1435 TaxID=2921704 RepID=UPI003159D14C
MYFSQLQQKMLLEQTSGTVIGYIEDAVINKDTGKIEGYVVGKTTKMFQKVSSERIVQVTDITSVGSDFIFIRLTGID